MSNQRLIFVSNRLPFIGSGNDNNMEFTNSSGGVMSGIRSYFEKMNVSPGYRLEKQLVWIWSSDVSERKFEETLKTDNFKNTGFEFAPIFSETTNDIFYNRFCNDVIWPLFHCYPSGAKFDDDDYDNYVNRNIQFCEKVLQLYQPGDMICIYDFHFLLLPALLRKKLPDAVLGFFLHIPFPSYEIFRLIPGKWKKELLEGLLGSDLIGFHTRDSADHFLKSVGETLGHENENGLINSSGRCIAANVFPINVDYKKINKASADNDVFVERNKIKKRLYGTKLIISIDSLNYAKGLANRLESYELFLSQYPEYRKKVTYLVLVVPSNDMIAKSMEIKMEIEGRISRINGKYSSIDWTPVMYQYKPLELKSRVATYLAADVAFITPIRDGMNLIAKEFIKSRKDKRGVLILGETVGASSEFLKAILVNTNDRQEMANAIVQALSMPVAEQMKRNEAMQKMLGECDISHWTDEFLSKLKKLKHGKCGIGEMDEPDGSQIANRYYTAKRRLILLDYDGTLTPLASLPHQAYPDDELLSLLQSLGQDLKNEIVIISGRPVKVLESWFGTLPLNLVAEHGAFYKRKNADWILATTQRAHWKSDVLRILKFFTERCPGTFVEEKSLSIAWHYRNAEKEMGILYSKELLDALVAVSTHFNFEIIDGNKVIEVRAKDVNKGTAASIWLKQNDPDFVLAIGDDKTDEDMFKVIPPSHYSIKVGLGQSAAKFNFKRQADVLFLLKKLHLINKTKNEAAGNFLS